MKNIDKTTTINLGRIIEMLRDGKFVIPDFQREFEWQPGDVKELLRSIFEDYYIGTLLFWKASKENLHVLSCKSIYGFEGKPEPEHIVLDGQQRLSALYYALFAPKIKFPNRKNRYIFTTKLDELLNENFDEAFQYEWLTQKVSAFLEDKQRQYKEKIFPLYILKDRHKGLIEWLDGYEKYWTKQGKEESACREREKIYKFFDEYLEQYVVSFIELDRDIEISKVCDIFTRINNTGIKLTIFDLINALMRPKDIYLKEMWRDVSNELEEYEEPRTKVHLLQTISILEQGYCAPKYLYYLVPKTQKVIKQPDGSKKSIIIFSSPKEFREKWNFVSKKMKDSLKSLANPRDFGAIRREFVPYPTMLPILTALNIEKEQEKFSDKRMEIESKIKMWYWASVFMQNYSSAVDSTMTHDYYAMQRWFENNEEIPQVVKKFENEIDNFDLSKVNTSTSAVYKAILNILVKKGARDFITLVLPEYSILEDHHIVPRSWGLKQKLKNIDTILNRTLLAKKTNSQVIADRLPRVYLQEMFNKVKDENDIYKLLESHLISKKSTDILMRNNFSREDFNEFIEERQKMIIQEIKSLLGIDVNPASSKLIKPETPFSNILQIENTIKKCEGYLCWVDKYFTRSGLEIIMKAFSGEENFSIKEIKILTSLEKVDSNLRNDFKRFKEELKNKGLNVEMRVISSKSTASLIHDRWIISKYKTYNVPSSDVIMRGQYSEIKETDKKIPFEKWWNDSLDIINDWQKILEAKTQKK